ncbi:unnamed protein product, partial [Prorocentrum cordatum]
GPDIAERASLQWLWLVRARAMRLQVLVDQFYTQGKLGKLFPGEEIRQRLLEDPKMVDQLHEYRAPMTKPLADGSAPWTQCAHRPRWFAIFYNQHGNREQCSKCRARSSYQEVGFRGVGHQQTTASELRKIDKHQLPRDVRHVATAPNDENTWSSFNMEPPPPWAMEMMRGLSAAVTEAMSASTGPMTEALRQQSATLSHMMNTMQQMGSESAAAGRGSALGPPASTGGSPPTAAGTSIDRGFTVVEPPADNDTKDI